MEISWVLGVPSIAPPHGGFDSMLALRTRRTCYHEALYAAAGYYLRPLLCAPIPWKVSGPYSGRL